MAKAKELSLLESAADIEKRFLFYKRLIPLLDFGRERDTVDLSKVVLTHHTLKNQGKQPIPVTGQDATTAGIQRILAGEQSMTVYKAIKAEAEAAAQLAIALLKGEDVANLATGSTNNGTTDVPSVLLTPVSVTKDNIKETVIADGFRSWDEICVGEYEQFCPADR